MSLLSQYRLWSDKRALSRIKWTLSLIFSPDFVDSKTDEELIRWIYDYEKEHGEDDICVRTLPQIAKSFDLIWDCIVEYGNPDDVKGRMQALADSLQ